LLKKKDVRIDELEKQKQIDRSKLLDLKENYDASERMVMEIKTRLELEQMQRRRLEAKLKNAYDPSTNILNSSPSTKSIERKGNDSLDNNDKLSEMSKLEIIDNRVYGQETVLHESNYDIDINQTIINNDDVLDQDSSLSIIGVNNDQITNNDDTNMTDSMLKMIRTGIAGDDEDFMAEEQRNPVDLISKRRMASNEHVMNQVTSALDSRLAAESNKQEMRYISATKNFMRERKQVEDRCTIKTKSKVTELRKLVENEAIRLNEDNEPFDNDHPHKDLSDEVKESIENTKNFLFNRLKKKNTENEGTDVVDAQVIADHLASESYIKQRNEKEGKEPLVIE
jgi:hypothetical protein